MVVARVRVWAGKEPPVEGLLDGVGPGWHYTSLQTIRPNRLEQEAYPDAQDIAHMALEIYQQGGAISVSEAQPVYLRDTVSWKKRTRIRTSIISGQPRWGGVFYAERGTQQAEG